MLALRLAIKDFRKDARAFLGLSLALAAILAPLLILMALKTGITGAMLEELKRDPEILEIDFLGNATLDAEKLREIRGLPGVGFMAELPRSMGELVEVLTGMNRFTAVTLRSSGEGDPYLAGLAAPGPGEIVLSRRSAAEITDVPGTPLIIVLSNARTKEEFDVAVTLAGVSDILPGRFALTHPDIVFAAEAVARGEAVPGLAIPGTPPGGPDRDVGRIRLFADDLASVAPLAAELERLGYVVSGKWPQIEGVLRLEQNLRLLLVVIAVLSGAGFAVSFAISIWVNVEKKRKSLAMLRLMGAPSRDMMLFPMVQALTVTLIGVAAAIVIFLVVRALLNISFAGSLPGGAKIAAFPVSEIGLLVFVTLFMAIVAGGMGGIAVARLEPKEALRDA